MKEANERGHFREERGAHCTQPLDQALDSIRSPRTKHSRQLLDSGNGLGTNDDYSPQDKALKATLLLQHCCR